MHHLSLVLCLILVTPVAFAEKAEWHRFHFPTDGPVPKGLVLRILGDLASQHPEAVTPVLVTKAGLDAVEARDLTTYLADLSREHQEERRASEIRIACDNASATRTDSEAYELFDLVDDVRFAVDHKFYDIARADLTQKQLEALHILMKHAEPGTTVIVLDHEAFYRGAPEGTATNDLAQFCADRGR